MALPVVLLKVKGAASKAAKGLKAAKTAKDVKDAVSDDEAAKSIITGPIKVIASIGALGCAVVLFLVFTFIMIIAYVIANAAAWLGWTGLGTTSGSSSHGGGTASGEAMEIVEVARAQIGKPYVWAAEGPNSFDCSGLVTYCYRVVYGVEIPHYTGSQILDPRFETVSSVDQLVAGDIILDGGSMPSHVGIYTGNGTVIHAPTFGDYVREVSLQEFYNWVVGAETFRHYVG